MYLTDKKVAVLGAAGAIGSIVVQTLLTTETANNILMYDPLEKPLQGTAEEIYHCAFPGANVTWTLDVAEALTDAAYIITAGGAPRREGMTREDLRRGNAEIAMQLGCDIKQYTPNCQFVIVIFNPADITGLVTLVHSGLPPSRVTTLAALDSTRLQTALAQHFRIPQDRVIGCRTYGGHGEEMGVFKGKVRVNGIPLSDILAGTPVNGISLTKDEWTGIKEHVRQGGAKVIALRGRSSFQSPAHHSVFMLRTVLGKGPYEWPCGAYVNVEPFSQVMMAMNTHLTKEGITWELPTGDEEDMASLHRAYTHLVSLRDATVEDGILPPLSEWAQHNRYL